MEYLTEQVLKKLIDERNRVYIYGAGMVGSLVLLRLRAIGIKDTNIDFVVSKAAANQRYFEHNVYTVSESDIKPNDIIIVATLPKNQGQIINLLKQQNYDNYVRVDDELFDEMESNYISNYLKVHHNSICGDKDVLFMSSDNNYTSGAFLCLVDLCRDMKQSGLRPLIVLPGFGNGEQLLIDNDLEYTFVQSRDGLVDNKDTFIRKQCINKKAAIEIENLINKYKVRLVHNNTNHTYVGALVAKNLGVSYIWHSRENVKEQGFEFFDEDYMYDIINSADKIITVSNYISDCYQKLDRTKTICIYDGVEVEKYYCKRDILIDNKIKILMPGIMVPLKGQHQLIEAAGELKTKGLVFDISLVGSGDADYIKKLENLVDLYGLDGSVHFYDRVSNLEDWYKAADVVVVCSRSEAFGRVTVEAQLSGCVVIGAKCGATVELLEDEKTGYLYELDNVSMLESKIREIYENRAKAIDIAQKGQENALAKYDKSLTFKNVLNVYKEILGDNYEIKI